MGARLVDLALVEHDDAVGVDDGREAVRDDDAGAPGRHAVERVQDERLRLRVQRRRRLVEEQDLRVLQRRARDRDALLLAAAQLEPTLADDGVEPLRERALDAVHGRHVDAVRDLGLGRLRPPVVHVVLERLVEQHRVLRHDPDRLPHALKLHVAQVLRAHTLSHQSQPPHASFTAAIPHSTSARTHAARDDSRTQATTLRLARRRRQHLAVDRNAAGIHVVEAEQQPQHSRLPAPRRPDDGHCLPRLDCKRHALQHLPPISISEPDVLELDSTIGDSEGLSAWL
eukprot:1689302-Rhodomonas_salina.1